MPFSVAQNCTRTFLSLSEHLHVIFNIQLSYILKKLWSFISLAFFQHLNSLTKRAEFRLLLVSDRLTLLSAILITDRLIPFW